MMLSRTVPQFYSKNFSVISLSLKFIFLAFLKYFREFHIKLLPIRKRVAQNQTPDNGRLIILFFPMGGLLAKLAFKSGSEGLASQGSNNFFDFKVRDIQGKDFDLNSLRNKKLIMVVNVACKCGLTSENYTELVKAHEKWKGSGFEILAFPCNQFNNQENGTPEEITGFVKENFNASFPIMEKIEVNGPKTHPLYVYLRSNSSLYDPKTKEAKLIPWNFAKFFINPQGKVIEFFGPMVKVEEVLTYIEQTLKK